MFHRITDTEWLVRMTDTGCCATYEYNANLLKDYSTKCQPMKSRLYQMPTHEKSTLPNANPLKDDSTRCQRKKSRISLHVTEDAIAKPFET